MKSTLFLFLALIFTPACALASNFPLGLVLAQANQIHVAGKTPIAVFDLDETLIHSAKRKVLSYLEALRANQSTVLALYPKENSVADDFLSHQGEALMRSLTNEYNSNEFFQKMGIVNPDFVTKLDALMLPIYLSNEWIHFDTAYRGAVQLLNGIYHAGGKVYFVTSRLQDTQSADTLKNLQALHLYQNSQQSFLMMRNQGEASLDFKNRAYHSIQGLLGANDQVFLAGENEPENLNALGVAFPSAELIFVEGAILNQTVALNANKVILMVRDFSI